MITVLISLVMCYYCGGKQFLLDMCLRLSLGHPVTVGYGGLGPPGWVLDTRLMTLHCKKNYCCEIKEMNKML
jgi:hypothetical protein